MGQRAGLWLTIHSRRVNPGIWHAVRWERRAIKKPACGLVWLSAGFQKNLINAKYAVCFCGDDMDKRASRLQAALEAYSEAARAFEEAVRVIGTEEVVSSIELEKRMEELDAAHKILRAETAAMSHRTDKS